MSVIDADGHIIEPEGMFEHLPEEFHLRRPIPVRLPADTVRGDFNGCWLIEGKSVPNIGSRGRTTASISWTERSKKIDVSLGSQTLEDIPAVRPGSVPHRLPDRLPHNVSRRRSGGCETRSRVVSRLQLLRRSSLRQVKRPGQVDSAATVSRSRGRGEGAAQRKRSRRFGYFHHGNGVGAESGRSGVLSDL